MRIFIAGSTGVIGRRLVAQFVDHGHTVVGLTRDDRGDDIVEARGGDPYRGDLFDEESMIRGAKDADVVVHAATAIPTDDPTPEEWALNDRVRREGAHVLTTAGAEVGADQYLQQSIVWVARQPGGAAFDEESPLDPDSITQSAVDAEEIALEAGENYGFDVGVVRCGYFYAPDAYHTRAHGEALVRGKQPIIEGSEDAKISRIHASDAASAFVAVAEAGESGVWHAVDDEPVSAAAFSTSLAEHLDAPVPKRVSAETARRSVGDIQVKLLTNPMLTSNSKLRTEAGWEPAYPTYQDGLNDVVETWGEEGYLP
ncbi:NAD-dependent epimerase/dehydratase family protein [Natrialba asiatica]|uniref:NAD-dependent epimerase/dehydratase n=1 Tax=Natrialba asiatica (strain ATCC 700177 / DSM 12278 / JCM 9576 / FERM P-10747 / NBRC 102637 / 172P1) TaxID=29540 RepID=M0B8A0_NATA1|nr:NAD-dependent epimerase/dehydratase family protein [Natrialba asiatica]ELZ05884.1 NAD-dependent epimerase/dehydratase [Natrialba asiatica DSM 12278]